MIENEIAKFITPLPPSVNSYLGKKVAWNPITKKYFVQVYETAEAKQFKRLMKKLLKREVLDCGWKKTEKFEYVICEVKAFFPQKKRDCDNIFKCLFDSFTENELIYDDSMIIPRVEDIIIDTENPRLEVKLYKANKVGLFKNNEHLEMFQNKNCFCCSRMSRNCSIRRKLLENKKTKEVCIEEMICSAKKGGRL